MFHTMDRVKYFFSPFKKKSQKHHIFYCQCSQLAQGFFFATFPMTTWLHSFLCIATLFQVILHMKFMFKWTVTEWTSESTNTCVKSFHVSNIVCPRGKLLPANPAGYGTSLCMNLAFNFTTKLSPTAWARKMTDVCT